MQVTGIQSYHFNNYQIGTKNNSVRPTPSKNTPIERERERIQMEDNFDQRIYTSSVSFGQKHSRRMVRDIDYEEYVAMPPYAKHRFRKIYDRFPNNIDKSEMYDTKVKVLPLRNEKAMDEFLKTSSIYKKYKDQPIICLGRSPKWFLNAALWMTDGIDGYKFVAFSQSWYRPNYYEGVKRLDSAAPTEAEEKEYRRYLKQIQADPLTIVNHYKETGKKTVITDYICTGKGATSFLEVMGNLAQEQGVLEEFSHAIQIVGIGSMDYMEELDPDADSISEPMVYMPPILKPYFRNIKQEFYNMNYFMFREMLIDPNTNECRSTFYPHAMWTKYKPNKFRTGQIKDIKKVEDKIKESNEKDKYIVAFTPAMGDYRNLLNFRILDALWQRGMLKEKHKSKV